MMVIMVVTLMNVDACRGQHPEKDQKSLKLSASRQLDAIYY